MAGHKPRLGITIGDPSGIGPEVTLKALIYGNLQDYQPLIISRFDHLEKHYGKLLKSIPSLRICRDREDLARKEKDSAILFLDIPGNNPLPPPGPGNPETGRESLRYIDLALDLWKEGGIEAIVTGPVSKSLIEKSGQPFTGHTEYMADYIGEKNPFMMMFSRDYRVLLATTHLPLSQVPNAVTEDRLLHTIRTGYQAIHALDGGEVKIALTGLDPHCGDEGAIGDFDVRITRRAIDRARSSGLPVEGPFAADTLFLPERWKQYSLVIVPYHDQGLIPFKMLAFDTGVNVTLGLSLVRTSVDHGTAFDIAGKNKAGHQSMIEAMDLAFRLLKYRSGELSAQPGENISD